MNLRTYQILFLVLAALLAGCGGEDEEALTKAQFVKQGDAICARQSKQKDAELIKGYESLEKNAGRQAEAQLIADIALPPIAEMTEELADLGLPEGQQDEAEQFISEMETAISEVEEDPTRALTTEPFDKAKASAKRLGFTACQSF
jgi:hypothetical protein